VRRDAIDWKNGCVTFWDLDSVDPDSPLADLEALKEDLAQVAFPTDVLVDVGWYPECSSNGSFRILVVRGSSWNLPVTTASARTGRGLVRALNRAVRTAESLSCGPY
jgi:hypothetical protein